MALIATTAGDLDLPVTLDEPFLDVATVQFQVPCGHDVVRAGGLDQWRPIRVTIWDGGTTPIVIPGFVVDSESQGGIASVTAYDSAILLKKRSLPPFSSGNRTAGGLAETLLAAVDLRPERFTPHDRDVVAYGTYSNGVSGSFHLAFDHDERTHAWFPVRTTGASTVDYRRFGVTIPDGLAVATANLRLIHYYTLASEAKALPRLRVSTDDGSSYGAWHELPLNEANTRVVSVVDVTDDASWDATTLSDSNLRVQVECVTSDGSDTSSWWQLFDLALTVGFSGVDTTFPIGVGEIEKSGDLITLSEERQTMFDWLSELADRSQQEWQLRPTGSLEEAVLDWRERIGEEVAFTLELSDGDRPLGSLEEGQALASPRSGLYGLSYFNRIRAVAKDLPDHVLDEDSEIARLGGQIHERVISLPDGATAEEQTAAAARELARVGWPAPVSELPVPRQPGLWASLSNGNSYLVRLKHGPYAVWEGLVRQVGRRVDEPQGMLYATVVAVEDRGTDASPSGSGTKVIRPVTSVKRDPRRQAAVRLRRLVSGLVDQIRRS